MKLQLLWVSVLLLSSCCVLAHRSDKKRQIKTEEGYVIEEIKDEVVSQATKAEDEDSEIELNVGGLRSGLANETETLGRVFYNGSQVWKVKIDNRKQLRTLTELKKGKG